MAGTLTVKTTNRTIEVSLIDSSYMMPIKLNVQSVIFIPANSKSFNYVYIIENSIEVIDPVKVLLESSDGEPRGWLSSNQRLQLGFIYENGSFEEESKVIFNIGERGY
jgi:hypothetical protein